MERPASRTLRLLCTDMLRVSELVVSGTHKDRTKACLASITLFLAFHLAYYDHLNKMSLKIDAQSSSEYLDVNTGVSKAELLSSERDQDAEMQRDYWFGKKYLECIVAQDMLQSISLHETVAVLMYAKSWMSSEAQIETVR